MTHLPVDDIRPQFDALFSESTSPARPVIVTAPTGSGKSTRLPLWMRDLCAPAGKVLVIEPRRVACRALATYLAQQAGEKVGDSIGYSVRFEDVRGKNTRVLFATPGVALRILSAPTLDFELVLIDEFHERGWEVDLVASIIQRRRAQGASLGFVLTSATLDSESLQRSLDATLIEATGRTYPVDITYQSDAAMPSDEDLEQRVARAVRRALDDGGDGEILVFLPGKGEIEACARALDALERASHGKIEVLQVHASLPMNRLMRAFDPPTPGKRRIFLSTNVAETSVTLPGVTWVIDSGLVRMQVHRAGKTALSLLPISCASMDQRAGRAGRVRPGKCIRLWEERYAPAEVTAPEIERVELDDMVLRAAICGLDVPRLEAMPWVTPPPPFAVERARARLTALGALTRSGELTEKGRALLAMPVSTEAARLLVDLPKELAGTVADLVAVMERGYRLMLPVDFLPADRRERVIEARKQLLDGVRDEVYEALTVLRHGDGRAHHLHEVGLRETRQIAASLRALVSASSRTPERDDQPLPDRDQLAAHLLTRAPEMGFVLRERAQNRAPDPRKKSRAQPWANGEVEVSFTPYIPMDIKENPHHTDPICGVMCDHTWLGDRKGYGARGRGNLLLPCSRATLAEHVPGELEVGELEITRQRGEVRISAQVVKKLAGVTLSSRHEPLSGLALREAVAGLVLENRLFKGTGEALQDRLHWLAILSQWMETLETQHWDLKRLHALADPLLEEPRAWLVRRLEELGLERGEELALLEGEDLLPDVAAEAGIFSNELEELQESFPRIWEYQGAPYRCIVSPKQRKVELEPANRTAKQAKEPPASVLPRFQGYRVLYRQASRVITLR